MEDDREPHPILRKRPDGTIGIMDVGCYAVDPEWIDDKEYGYSGPDAYMHDISVLPHDYSADDIEEMFPRAVVAEDVADQLVDLDGIDGGRFVDCSRSLP